MLDLCAVEKGEKGLDYIARLTDAGAFYFGGTMNLHIMSKNTETLEEHWFFDPMWVQSNGIDFSGWGHAMALKVSNEMWGTPTENQASRDARWKKYYGSSSAGR